MYNGIGLPTPRGSGTNGYVQKNLAFINNFKEKPVYKTDEDVKRADAAFFKEPNKEILEHERKRKVEVKCFEMEQAMEDQGYTEEEIGLKVSAFRTKLLEDLKTSEQKASAIIRAPADALEKETGRLIPKGTHETAAVNMLKNTVFKEALGIGADFEDGNSMALLNARRVDEQETKRLIEAQKNMSTMDSSSDESSKESRSERQKRRSSKHKKHCSSTSLSQSDDRHGHSDLDEEGSRSKLHRKHKHRTSEKSCSKKRKRSRSGDRRKYHH